jgi:hypothetical protein
MFIARLYCCLTALLKDDPYPKVIPPFADHTKLVTLMGFQVETDWYFVRSISRFQLKNIE